MIRGSETRNPEHPVHPIFLDRWSPYAFAAEPIPRPDLEVILEAARWAPSSYNAQPWRILYARRGDDHWDAFLDLLVDANRAWAKDAGALLVVVSRKTFERNGRPSRTHSLDAGAAWENLALQATLLGYAAHGMEGFDYERARTALRVPEPYEVEMMAAVGKPGAAGAERSGPSGRKPLAEIAFAGVFPEARS